MGDPSIVPQAEFLQRRETCFLRCYGREQPSTFHLLRFTRCNEIVGHDGVHPCGAAKLKTHLDLPTEKISRVVTSALWKAVRARKEKDLRARCAKEIAVPAACEIEPQVALEYLHQVRRVVEQILLEEVNLRSSFQWIWFLRRLPPFVYAGSISSTFYGNVRITETASGFSALNDHVITPGEIRFPIVQETLIGILGFCAIARFLRRVHALIRIAGKGARFVCPSGADPVPIMTSDLEIAIKLYDDRNASPTRFMARGGTVTASVSSENENTDSIQLLFRTLESKRSVVFLGKLSERQRPAWAAVNYDGIIVSLQNLRSLNFNAAFIHYPWYQAEITTLLVFLRVCLCALYHLPGATVDVWRRGYLSLPESMFVALYHECYEREFAVVQCLFPAASRHSTAVEMVQNLESIKGQLWPLRVGPVIRRHGELLCIDYGAITSRLESALKLPASCGAIANIRASHFERSVQQVINESPWRPSNSMQAYRGRTLCFSGKAVTDIDALACRNGRLLLVSCKSHIYSEEEELGNYRTVRNAASNALHAVEIWSQKLEFLRRNPIGNNYDFHGFSSIDGVVCTPYPVYVQIGAATAMPLPNLYACCSLNELADWLYTN